MNDVPPIGPNAHERALRNAWRDHIGGLLTEPMHIQTLADFFGVGRNKMSKMLKRMHSKGVEKWDDQYRVPIRLMPPSYFADRGFLPRD